MRNKRKNINHRDYKKGELSLNKRKKKKCIKKYIKSLLLTRTVWAMFGRYVPQDAIPSNIDFSNCGYGKAKHYYLFSFSSTKKPCTRDEKDYVAHYRNEYKPSNAFCAYLIERNLYKAIQERITLQ